ncbi:MAG: hypothetical protein L0206_21820, partial [Actinobacteria bacterium]|nr:hypothetical protein [Actinomycetota bacterium]
MRGLRTTLAFALAACGARTSLEGPDATPEAGPEDAAPEPDASPDAGVDAGPYEVELVAGSSTSPWDCATQKDVGLSCTPKVLGVGSIRASGDIVWTASADADTVTRIDAKERTATARYQVAEGGERIQGLSTNLEGDVVVATQEGTLTRVAAGDCPAGDTSTSVDDVLPYGSDSCVLWSEEIVGAGDRLLHVVWELRSVLDAREYFVWVLEPSERRLIEVDADGAETGREVSVDPSLPRGLAVDTEGHLWVGSVDFQPRAIEIDPIEGEVLRRIVVGGQPTVGCVTVDREGGVWFANGNLMRIDQDTEAYDTVAVYSAGGLAEGEGSLIAAVGRVAFVDLGTL